MSAAAPQGPPEVTVERAWTRRDAVIYALGVGAGGLDRVAELPYCLEEEPELAVLPTYGTVLARRGEGLLEALGVDRATAQIVHGEQHLAIHRPIPPEGTLQAVSRLVACVPKRRGTVVWAQTDAVLADKPLLTSWSASFVRGAVLDGFGLAPDLPSTELDPAADDVVSVEQGTQQEQALWYRLSGDLNPLHTDDAVARRGGFEVPILHGLCTFGFAARHLLSRAGSGSGLLRIGGRFRSPVLPGERLRTRIWEGEAGRRAFDVVSSSGAIAISRGYAEVTVNE